MGADAARYLARWELAGVAGIVVAVDVIRAFTTAAYAFGAGAAEIWLVGDVQEALALSATMPGSLTMGEDRGRRPNGFDLSNSPVEVASADLSGRPIVQRTSAGTRGILAAIDADRLFASSLVCASATARAISHAGVDAPAYVITGRSETALERGADDFQTARFIEQLRIGEYADRELVAKFVRESDEASRTLALGDGDANPRDIDLVTDIDRFDFAMEAEQTDGRLRLVATVV